jgi:hypothetical protein
MEGRSMHNFELIGKWQPETLQDLKDLVDEALTQAASEGVEPDTVYLEKFVNRQPEDGFNMCRITLSDGSFVYDIRY